MKKILTTLFVMGVVASAQATSYDNRNFFDPAQTHINASNPNDTRLAEEIRDQLGTGWFSRGFDTVTFNVNDGAVVLQGTVPTAEDKANLENSIKGIDGVRSLKSSLTVQGQPAEDLKAQSKLLDPSEVQKIVQQFPQDKFATPEDRLLNAKIRYATSVGFFFNSFKNVRLNTRNGAVIVEGSVDSAKDQQKLIDAIREIHGVQGVTSSLNFAK